VPDSSGQAGWMVVGGTSAGAPQWAGLIALADQERAAHGQAALGRVADQIYQLPARDFHDITVGGNGYAAGPAYALGPGRGTPRATLLAPGVAGVAPPVISPPPAPTPPPTGTTGGGTGTGTGTTTQPPTGGISAPVWYIPGFGFVYGFGF